MKRYFVTFGLAVFAAVLITGIVYAATWGPSTSLNSTNGDLRFYGDSSWVILDTNEAHSADAGGSKNFYDETFLYVDTLLAGFATSHQDDTGGRGEILVDRAGTGSSQDASNAWMKSSADAMVKVQSDGDVVITLGN